MKMNTGKKYCSHYRNLAKHQEIVKRINNRWGYEKYEPPQDNSHCDDCDRYPALMRFKVCFRLRFKWRLRNFLQKLDRFPWRIKVIDLEKHPPAPDPPSPTTIEEMEKSGEVYRR